METIQAIFSQLGANGSVINQLVIVFVLFLISKYIFFNKLQFVIENREEKTTKLEMNADETFEKANKLAEKYKQKVEAAHLKAQQILNEKKSEIQARERETLKKTENDVAAYVETSKAQVKKDIDSKRNEILSESNHLAGMLVDKLTGKH